VQPDARATIPPFVEQPDGDDVIIANSTQTCFLAVPREAAQLLHLLADGNTVAEACAIYEGMYGVKPDVDDFLQTLTAEGFLRLEAESRSAHSVDKRRYHFENIPRSFAQRVCSWPVLALCGTLFILALLACASDPSLIPSPADLVFPRNPVGLTLVLALISAITLFVHELAHLIAARAAGVPSRMGLGNRLWILVAETDMTGIWLASPGRRCVAFIAGPLFDLVLCAALMLVLFATGRGWIELDENARLLARALVFLQLTRVLWQFYLFVPTDFYYVIGTAFRCKNLMHDTQVYLLNQLARALPGIPRREQSQIPLAEMRVVRAFAFVWVAGRLLAFVTLFAITVPVLLGYGEMLARGLTGDAQALRPLLEGPGLPIIAIVLQLTGITLWLRGLFRARGAYV
jgi:hypothetical protein